MRLSPFHVFAALFLICSVGLAFQPPMPQDPAYHFFADSRPFFGIPNFWNVVSNLPFFFIGGWGLVRGVQTWSSRSAGVPRFIPIVLSLGVFGVSFGSAYYHATPSNSTLLWDRLPMTLMFMALFSLVLYDFLGKKWGEVAFCLAVPFGVFSVLYWQWTENQGAGDLRPYGFVQFFPMLVVPIFLWAFPKKITYARLLWTSLLLYAVAKLAEHFDRPIFEMLGFWSGHTVKHFVAAASLFFALKITARWNPTPA